MHNKMLDFNTWTLFENAGSGIIKLLSKETVEKLYKSLDDRAIKYLDEVLIGINKNSLNFIVKENGEAFIKSLTGTELPIKMLDHGIDAVISGKMTAEELSKYLPRQVADGTPFREVLDLSLKQRKNVSKIAAKETAGNVKILDNVTDDLNLFGEWMTTVKNNTDISAHKIIEDTINLGKKLDGGSKTWKYGKLRAQVDGRLIIDVIADGERFLMYKSIGKGTTAKSAGEWVPLKGFAKNGWFIKDIYKGVDPKFNKYGSEVFNLISNHLKKMESSLF